MKKYYLLFISIFNPSIVYAETGQNNASIVASKIQNFSFVFFAILAIFFIMGMIVTSKLGIKSKQKRKVIFNIFCIIGVVVAAFFAKNQFL